MKMSVHLLITAFICTVSSLALAVPVRATFNGTVSDKVSYASPELLSAIPSGTAASFDVTFNATGRNGDIDPDDFAPVSGWLRLGSFEWLLDSAVLSNAGGTPFSFEVSFYGLSFEDPYPYIGGTDSFGSLYLPLTPAAPYSPVGKELRVEFLFIPPLPGGGAFGHDELYLVGSFTTSRETAVPEPNVWLLICSAFALLACMRRLRPTATEGKL